MRETRQYDYGASEKKEELNEIHLWVRVQAHLLGPLEPLESTVSDDDNDRTKKIRFVLQIPAGEEGTRTEKKRGERKTNLILEHGPKLSS